MDYTKEEKRAYTFGAVAFVCLLAYLIFPKELMKAFGNVTDVIANFLNWLF